MGRRAALMRACWAGACVAVLAAGFAAAQPPRAPSAASQSAAQPSLTALEEATTLARNAYYGLKPINWAQVQAAAVQRLRDCLPACNPAQQQAALGQVFSLFPDPHLGLVPAEQAARAKVAARGEKALGHGLWLRPLPAVGGSLVLGVQEGSPAQRAGLKAGDLLLIGEGELRLKAEAGQEASLQVVRAGRRLGFLLNSEQVLLRQPPSLRVVGGVPVLSIAAFDWENLPDELAPLLVGATEPLLIDLRDNSGGQLETCLRATSLLTSLVYRAEGAYAVMNLRAHNGHLGYLRPGAAASLSSVAPLTRPVAVLVSSRTASCAELMAYFLQKAGAFVVGESTRGALSTAASLYPLTGGALLSVPTFRVTTPQGQPFPRRVTPDLIVPFDAAGLLLRGEDNQISAAIRRLEQGP